MLKDLLVCPTRLHIELDRALALSEIRATVLDVNIVGS